jgi:K+ transporter
MKSRMHAGTEALFADVGHFTVRSIQISMCSLTYPALVLAYTGQAAFLRKNMNLVANTFFKSIPGQIFMKNFTYTVTSIPSIYIYIYIYISVFAIIIFKLKNLQCRYFMF